MYTFFNVLFNLLGVALIFYGALSKPKGHSNEMTIQMMALFVGLSILLGWATVVGLFYNMSTLFKMVL